MHPVVQPTTRMPGPSTADPVVKECRNPISPCARAVRTSVSGTSLPRSTRRSKGLFASNGTRFASLAWAMSVPSLRSSGAVESAVDDVHLLLAGEPHEVHCVTRYPDGEARIFFRMLHGVEQRLAIEHVDVHVKAGDAEVRIE